MMPQQMLAPAAAPQQPVFPTPEDIAQIQQMTGYAPEKIMQDVQSTGAQSVEDLYAAYGQQGGVDPSVMQGASGMPAPDQSQTMPAQPPLASGPRGMAQAAMRGEPMPDEMEPAGEMGQESMMPGAEAAEGIQPNIAMAAHSQRSAPMHRSMKGKPAHVAGNRRGRRG